jgi:hypothetical protein
MMPCPESPFLSKVATDTSPSSGWACFNDRPQ